MKKNRIGLLVLIGIFALFYIVTTLLLDRRNISKSVPVNEETIKEDNKNYDNEKNIINNLYQDARILYDVVSNKFKVSQEETIIIGDIVYKKITNFEEVTNSLFTRNGLDKYLEDIGNYFAITEDGYYLAGNLVSYQTYYFRGDDTNIFILESYESEINGIIYEKWTSNSRNTLATIKVIQENGKWLIDEINILSSN